MNSLQPRAVVPIYLEKTQAKAMKICDIRANGTLHKKCVQNIPAKKVAYCQKKESLKTAICFWSIGRFIILFHPSTIPRALHTMTSSG